MRRFLGLFAVCLLLAGSADALQWGVKTGGGVVFKPSPSRWGGHASLEIPLSEDYPTSLSAFFEIYRKSSINQMPAGLSIHYKAPLTRWGGTIYFAGGGGVLRVSGLGNSLTNGMLTVAGGGIIPVTESVGVFGQFRWFKAFASGSVNEYGLQFGLHFPLGRE
jgi:hypothetical protein